MQGKYRCYLAARPIVALLLVLLALPYLTGILANNIKISSDIGSYVSESAFVAALGVLVFFFAKINIVTEIIGDVIFAVFLLFELNSANGLGGWLAVQIFGPPIIVYLLLSLDDEILNFIWNFFQKKEERRWLNYGGTLTLLVIGTLMAYTSLLALKARAIEKDRQVYRQDIEQPQLKGTRDRAISNRVTH